MWDFSQELKNFVSLKALSLRFMRLDQITDEGVKSICEGLESLTSLTSIDLDFSQFDEFLIKNWLMNFE